MLREALQQIQEMANRPATVDAKAVPGKLLVRKPDGEVELLTDPNAKRRVVVGTLQSFIDAVLWYRDHSLASGWQPVIFVSVDRIWCILDDAADCRFEIELDPKPNHFVRTALDGDSQWYTQAALVLLLRTRLRNAVTPDILASIRALEWKSRADKTSEVRNGRESLGRAVEKVVASADAIPEEVMIRCNAFDAIEDIAADASFAVELDMVGERFRLLPVGASVNTAVQSCLLSVARNIDGQVNAEDIAEKLIPILIA